jgi:hypothetical protein
MGKSQIRQLDSQGDIYATVDERGSIIGTGSKEVCEFLANLANQELGPVVPVSSVPRTNQATVRSAIEI